MIREGIKGRKGYYLEFGNNKWERIDLRLLMAKELNEGISCARNTILIITVEISNRCSSISVSIVVLVL